MLRRKPRPQSVSGKYGSFPASTRGLNLRDSKASMDKRDALVLDNYFPEQTFIRLRRGASSWATGFPAAVETLMEWSGPAGRKQFAASGTAIYETTAGGAIGAASVSSLSNARWQHVNFTNSAGSAFLVIANGADSVRNYDGSSWTTPSITGVTSSDLINVASHMRRLWFVKKDSTEAWYLPVDSIAGAAAKLDLGAVFKKGGKLRCIGTLSQDAGDGIDDYLAFFSSNGEIALYQGTDPSSASTWAIVGTFQAGAPVGDRALLKVGGDLGLIGADGIVSVQQMLSLDRGAAQKAAITNRIDPAFADAYRLYSSNTGWQAITYTRGHMALVNIPVSASQAIQYVMNTQTGAWCRFTGWNARSWGLFNEALYFGTDDAVMLAETGTSDASVAIEGDWQPAFQNFGSHGLKHFKMARPLYRASAGPTLAIKINTDYRDERPAASDAMPVAFTGPTWGSVVWGAFVWAAVATQSAWMAATGSGFTASARLYSSTSSASIEIDQIDTIFERGQGVSI